VGRAIEVAEISGRGIIGSSIQLKKKQEGVRTTGSKKREKTSIDRVTRRGSSNFQGKNDKKTTTLSRRGEKQPPDSYMG